MPFPHSPGSNRVLSNVVGTKGKSMPFGSDGSDDDDVPDEQLGDYSRRIEELFNDSEDDELDILADVREGSDGDAEFQYESANLSVGYHDQLRDVLERDVDSDDESNRGAAVVVHVKARGPTALPDLPASRENTLDSYSPSPSNKAPKSASASAVVQQFQLARPFIHPTVSRLRSHTPGASHRTTSLSATTSHSQILDGLSPIPSRFSSMSRVSSISNIRGVLNHGSTIDVVDSASLHAETIFKWAELKKVTVELYSQPSRVKPFSGETALGSPTTLAANGLLCLGTVEGMVFVYDFKQNLKCVCGKGSAVYPHVGAVSALALSHDHTFIACGYTSGYIQLYELQRPQVPARSVPPTTLAAVSSGRKEGHLQGSRIVSIGFVAGRHTAVVSADAHGLSFYHTLGKVLFVDASDVLRILGKYPDAEKNYATPREQSASLKPGTVRRRQRYTILAMAPMPLGPSPDNVELYNIVALLTPTKLVIVGLKPTPRTWFKCQRSAGPGATVQFKGKQRGTLAWYPCVATSSSCELGRSVNEENDVRPVVTSPRLVYTWDAHLFLISVFESSLKHTVRDSKTGRISEVTIGTISYKYIGNWTAEEDILVVQWLNVNQIVTVTGTMLGIFDVQAWKLTERTTFDGLSLISPYTSIHDYDNTPRALDVSHSVRVYKGRIFLLGRKSIQVGTLLTWADRILSFVENGDFLSAIDVTRSYYTGEAPGNRNGLPTDRQSQQKVIGQKLREVMIASARYTFSEDRMTDETHVTTDGRGVDRTSLFEDLVTVSCRACVALDDFEFLFEDLFQQYDDSGISAIYLRRLEPFVLNNDIRYVPPRITQRLISLHDADRRPDHVERIIWHIDPQCLDINQAIQLCQKHHLYDALIYVYTRALQDYVASVVMLLELIRIIQRQRKSLMHLSIVGIGSHDAEFLSMDTAIVNAYKIYPYLANVLSGLVYPSENPLTPDDAARAKEDVYTFLFSGCSSVWPLDSGGKLVLTADEDGGSEPTYPYVRQLLLFDSESFLHTLDIAFEDTYLNDGTHGVNRLIIIRILLDILATNSLSQEDVTLIHIFIARNVPKYPQFLHIAPSVLHMILIKLAQDPDSKTREDRQLAAEYLLSIYNPHDREEIIRLFEWAGFYRILRAWFRQERFWPALLSTYIDDVECRNDELFEKVDELLRSASGDNQEPLSDEIVVILSSSFPRLLRASVSRTAALIDYHLPNLHQKVLQSMGAQGIDRYTYLRHLLGPPRVDEDDHLGPRRRLSPSVHISEHLREQYVALHCQYNPGEVVDAFAYLPINFLDWDKVAQICETAEVYDPVVWSLNHRNKPQEAVTKAVSLQKDLSRRLVSHITGKAGALDLKQIVERDLTFLEVIARRGTAICMQRSRENDAPFSLEDIWFQLLSSQINNVQFISESLVGGSPPENSVHADEREYVLSHLRALVQETFAGLVSITSHHVVSFPRLFKRLVSSASASTGTQYTEFRTILTRMLESYRSDGEMLIITKQLVDRDLFGMIAQITRERTHGWTVSKGICMYCHKPLHNTTNTNGRDASPSDTIIRVIVSRTGDIYHAACLPSQN